MSDIRERIKAWLRDTPANASQLLRSSQLLRDADEEIERLRKLCEPVAESDAERMFWDKVDSEGGDS